MEKLKLEIKREIPLEDGGENQVDKRRSGDGKLRRPSVKTRAAAVEVLDEGFPILKGKGLQWRFAIVGSMISHTLILIGREVQFG